MGLSSSTLPHVLLLLFPSPYRPEFQTSQCCSGLLRIRQNRPFRETSLTDTKRLILIPGQSQPQIMPISFHGLTCPSASEAGTTQIILTVLVILFPLSNTMNWRRSTVYTSFYHIFSIRCFFAQGASVENRAKGKSIIAGVSQHLSYHNL